MLIHPESKSIVLRLRDPRRVLATIPTAREVEVQGQRLIAVPHRLDETRVLRNLGIEVPSPILHHYDWPGRYKPFEAQRRTSAFLTLNARAFVLNDMGTGKTLAALWAADYLMTRKLIRRALVVAPLSTLESVWSDEIFQNIPRRTAAVLHGSAERRRRLLRDDYDFYIINHDGVEVVEKELLSRDDVDLVIVDELDAYRNARNDRWKALNRVINRSTRPMLAWGMTGTPIPNGPDDAWGQARLILPRSVPAWFKQFRDRVMLKVSQYKYVPRADAVDTVYRTLVPAIRIPRDACVDLPPTMYSQRHVQLTDEQSKAYDEMMLKLKAEVDAGQVVAVNEAVKLGKLVQIACGVLYGDSEEYRIPVSPRIAVVKEIIAQAAGKTIVFVPFTGTLNLLEEELSKEFQVLRVDGGVAPAARRPIFQRFRDDPAVRVLVAHPDVMSHGLTLVESNTIVWYAPYTKPGVFDQANHRIIRAGQKRSQFIVMIEGSAVERGIYARLKAKQTLQGTLLDLVKGGS